MRVSSFLCCSLFALGLPSLGSAQMSTSEPIEFPAWSETILRMEEASTLNQAYEALQQGNAALALKRFDQIIAEAPDAVAAYLGKAEALHRLGQVQNAEGLLRDLQKKFPEESTPLISLARLLVAKREFREAESLLRAALEKNRDTIALVDLGTLLSADESRLEEAIDLLLEAIRLDPAHAGAHFALGTAFLRMGELEQAIAEWQTTTELAPKRAGAWRQLATAQIAAQRPREALQTYEKAVEALPETALLFLEAGDLKDALGDKPGATELYNRALTLDPDSAEVWFRFGTFHHRNADYAAADAAYTKALEHAPDAIAILNNKAALAIDWPEADHSKALALIRRGLEQAPRNPELLDTLAQLLEADGQFAEALAAYEQASAQAPEAPLLQFRLARVRFALGDKEAAKETLTRILEQYPNFPQRSEASALLEKMNP